MAALAFQTPAGWAQPLEIADVERTQTMVQAEVERLMTEVAARDPELAQEIEKQAELCIRDFSDGQLEHEGFTKDIENFRDVRDVMEQMMGGGAEGEHPAPTPEMMERMSQEMEQLMAERPELAEYARAEFSEYARETMEAFGREMGGPEHFREMGEHFREMGERLHEQYEREAREYYEREYGARLDELAQHFLDSGSPPPGEGPHTLVTDISGPDSDWDGNDSDSLGDHPHPDGTPPHTGP